MCPGHLALSIRFDESEMVSQSVSPPAGSVVTSPPAGRDVVITDRLPPRTHLFIACPVQAWSASIYCNPNTSCKKLTSNTLIRVPICDSITRRIKIENIEHDNNNHLPHQEDLDKNCYSFVNQIIILTNIGGRKPPA